MSEDVQKLAKSLEEVNAGFREILAELRKLDQQLSKQIKIAREVEG